MDTAVVRIVSYEHLPYSYNSIEIWRIRENVLSVSLTVFAIVIAFLLTFVNISSDSVIVLNH